MAKKNLKRGWLITFEGPEGSGKSTHVRLLCSYLRRKGYKVLQLREPGGTVISEKIRQALLDPRNKKMNLACEMLLYQAARAQLVREKVIPALNQSKIVVLDRFLDATLTYQGYAGGLDVALIKWIGKLATYGRRPDLTILLDIPAKEGLRKSGRRDRIERKSLRFHRLVRQGYLLLARQNPKRIKTVPLSRAIAKTQEAIRKVIARKLKV